MQANKTVVGLVVQGPQDRLDELIKSIERDKYLQLLYVRRKKFVNSFMLIVELNRRS
jgi:hypothetical protein